MDGVHVHVGGVGLVHGAQHLFRPQHGHALAGFLGAQQARIGRDGAQYLPVRFEQGQLPRAGDHERAARRQQRMRGKARRRILQEGAACHRQRAYLRGAVAFHEQRRRAAGRVVAGLRFALEHDDAAMRCQPVRDGRTGNAAPDDEEVS